MKRFKKNIPALLGVLTLLTVWQIFSWSMGYPAIFPSLPDLFTKVLLIFVSGEFYKALLITILRGIIGFIISLVFSFIFSTIALFSPFWKSFLHPVIVFLRSIPVISLVLIALLWFSPDYLPVFIAFLTMFPILYQSMLNGLEITDKKLIEMSKVFGKSALIRFTSIYLPSAKTIIFGGISSAMGFGWRAVIIGEVLAQPLHGIGTNMKKAQSYLNISELIAWTLVAVVVSYFFDFIFKKMSSLKLIHHFNKHLYNKRHPEQVKRITKTIEIKQISKSFGENIIFDNFSTIFTSEKIHFLKAPSGKGKSTLLYLISDLQQINTGNINYRNIQSFAFSFQDLRLIPWLTVKENILYVVNKHKTNKKEILKNLDFLLRETEILEQVDKLPDELSGGQKQRVSLVRALIVNSDVLLLDEPLNGLDVDLKQKIVILIDNWITTYKPLVVWATHEDINLKKSEMSNVMF